MKYFIFQQFNNVNSKMLKKDYDLRNGWNEIIIDIKMNIKITKTKSNYDLFFEKTVRSTLKNSPS